MDGGDPNELSKKGILSTPTKDDQLVAGRFEEPSRRTSVAEGLLGLLLDF